MCQKTRQLLALILRDGPRGVTSLLKISYLIDLAAIRNIGYQISEFKYIRWNFGPFDSAIYKNLENMREEGIISADSQFIGTDEHVIYKLKDPDLVAANSLTPQEQDLVTEMPQHLQGFGAKTLTEVAYNRKPMTSIGAKLGGTEHMGEFLNMHA
ncbi:MAG: SocA family protein [Alphaproteobacteria bacterium]|nr:SocA family protein [Alphaproteobacteria bacterium]